MTPGETLFETRFFTRVATKAIVFKRFQSLDGINSKIVADMPVYTAWFIEHVRKVYHIRVSFWYYGSIACHCIARLQRMASTVFRGSSRYSRGWSLRIQRLTMCNTETPEVRVSSEQRKDPNRIVALTRVRGMVCKLLPFSKILKSRLRAPSYIFPTIFEN